MLAHKATFEQVHREVLKWVGITARTRGGSLTVNMCSGDGSENIVLAHASQQLIAVESNQLIAEDLRRSLMSRSIHNADVIVGDAANVQLPTMASSFFCLFGLHHIRSESMLTMNWVLQSKPHAILATVDWACCGSPHSTDTLSELWTLEEEQATTFVGGTAQSGEHRVVRRLRVKK